MVFRLLPDVSTNFIRSNKNEKGLAQSVTQNNSSFNSKCAAAKCRFVSEKRAAKGKTLFDPNGIILAAASRNVQ